MIRKLWIKTAAIGLLLLPVAAFAQDPDDNQPTPPSLLKEQRSTLGVIALCVLAAIVFYLVRRWQTIRSGNTVDGSYRDD